MPNPENIPLTLRSSGRWIVYRIQDTAERKGAKIPHHPDPQLDRPDGINHLDPKYWISFEQAWNHPAGFDGPGLVVGPPLIGIDIDGVRDPETGEIEIWALRWVKQLDTYCEISPSGTGLHLWLHGDAGQLTQETKEGIEIYAVKHYLTVTGEYLAGTPADVREASKEEIEALFAQVRDKKIRPQIELQGDEKTFDLLREGKITEAGYTDVSAAVAAFVTRLVYKLGAKPSEVDKAFRASALYGKINTGEKVSDWKKKWDRLHKKEIARAIQFVKEHPPSRKQQQQAERDKWTKREAIVVRGKDQKRTHPTFHWKPYLPSGKLVHFGGNSSQGKSPVTVDLAARITSAACWPDGAANHLGPRSVLLLNIEDDFNDTILPRFDLAGGDSERLFYVKGTRLSNDSTSVDRGMALDSDMDLLAQAARAIPDLALIVIDPITNYLGKLKMNAEEEVRSVLTPLAHLAGELGITVVTVGHFNRREKGTDPLFRMMGAAAFSGVARAVYSFGPDPEDEDKYAHVMAVVRGAVGEGISLRYMTEMVEQTWDGQSSEVVRVIWRGKSQATAEDTVDPDSRKDRNTENEAVELLKEFLKSGKKPSQECLQFLKNGGYEPDKLNLTRIRRKAGAASEQKDRQHWWFLKSALLDSEIDM